MHGKILAIAAHQELRAQQKEILVDLTHGDGSGALRAALHLHRLLD